MKLTKLLLIFVAAASSTMLAFSQPKPIDMLGKSATQLVSLLGKPSNADFGQEGSWYLNLEWKKFGLSVSPTSPSTSDLSAAKAKSALMAQNLKELHFELPSSIKSAGDLGTYIGVSTPGFLVEPADALPKDEASGMFYKPEQITASFYYLFSSGQRRFAAIVTPEYGERTEEKPASLWDILELNSPGAWGQSKMLLNAAGTGITKRSALSALRLSLREISPTAPPPVNLAPLKTFLIKGEWMPFRVSGGKLRLLMIPPTDANPYRSEKFAPLLWWTGGKIGDTYTATSEIPNGTYRVEITAYRGADFGKVHLSINDESNGIEFDGFSRKFEPVAINYPKQIVVKNGQLKIVYLITGENPASVAVRPEGTRMLGVDRIILTKI